MDSRAKALLIARFALDKKAEDLLILDMKKVSGFCDYFIICSAKSQRQIKAIVENIQGGLEKENIKLKNIEGKEDSGWLLLDYYDVVAHIFYSRSREFYNLERLWLDAPRVRIRTSLKKNVRKEGRRKSS